MNMRIAVLALALAVVACGRQGEAPAEGQAAPGGAPSDAPTQEAQPSRAFAPANDAARTVTGQLNLETALDLPDAGQTAGDAQETLTLRGASGVVVEAQIASAVSPATQVQGQTLRALLGIPVEEPQTLVYRVTNETRGAQGNGLCGANAADYVVVWEPAGVGEPVMKVLGLSGGAPGAASARACELLAYRRS